MDSVRSLSCSMILEVLANLCQGPQTLDELSNGCSMQNDYLKSVMSAAITSGLVDEIREKYQLTKKGARTAIYLLAVNEWMDFSKNEYRELMRALDNQIRSDSAAS